MSEYFEQITSQPAPSSEDTKPVDDQLAGFPSVRKSKKSKKKAKAVAAVEETVL